jgi:hypothetical protein
MGMAVGLSPAARLIHVLFSTIVIASHKAWRASRTYKSPKLGLPRYLLNMGAEVWIELDRLNRHVIHRT